MPPEPLETYSLPYTVRRFARIWDLLLLAGWLWVCVAAASWTARVPAGLVAWLQALRLRFREEVEAAGVKVQAPLQAVYYVAVSLALMDLRSPTPGRIIGLAAVLPLSLLLAVSGDGQVQLSEESLLLRGRGKRTDIALADIASVTSQKPGRPRLHWLPPARPVVVVRLRQNTRRRFPWTRELRLGMRLEDIDRFVASLSARAGLTAGQA